MMNPPSNVAELRDAWRAANAGADTPESGWSVDGPRVYVFGMIGGWRMNAGEFVQAIHAITAPMINVHVNSPGGFVWDAVSMYQALKEHPARVVAHVDGLAASAASFLVQAADDIVMGIGSRMMIHDAQGSGYGSPAEIQATVDVLNAVSDDIASIYAARTGGNPGVWRAAMTATTSYSAQQAVDVGLADRMSRKPPQDGPDNRTRIIQARNRARLMNYQ